MDDDIRFNFSLTAKMLADSNIATHASNHIPTARGASHNILKV